jgi:large subunit ribosomal protein L10e
MAKLRKFVCYRGLERPNTRKSKFRKKSFVRGNPALKIVKFNFGNLSAAFPVRMDLRTKSALQVRDNALEASRMTCVKLLEKVLGKNGFRLQVRVYPHHIFREHALATGAGADRFSTGMAHSFGKPAGNACQLKAKQIIISVYLNEATLPTAKEALRKAKNKLPMECTITTTKLKV